MSEIMVKNSTHDGVTYLTVHSVGSPVGHKDRDRCGIYPDYLKGSICYRVCGEIPRGRKPNRVAFFSRISHQGDATLWIECPGDGCEGSDPEFHKEGSKICGLFKLWKGDGSHRDLMMKVYLE